MIKRSFSQFLAMFFTAVLFFSLSSVAFAGSTEYLEKGVGDTTFLKAGSPSSGTATGWAWTSSDYYSVEIVSGAGDPTCEVKIVGYNSSPVIVHCLIYTQSLVGNRIVIGQDYKDYSITIKRPSYNVTLDAGGGSVSPSRLTVYYDGTYGSLPTPTRSGYTFDGWFTDRGYRVTSNSKIASNADHILYAEWTRNDYTIQYYGNGGAGVPSRQSKAPGESTYLSSTKPSRSSTTRNFTITLDANEGSVSPTSFSATENTSYTFRCWNTKSDGSGIVYESGERYSADADLSLYAQWDSSTITTSVTLPTPTRMDYTFKGWADSSTATSGVTGSYTPTGNTTLYAVWQPSSVVDSGTWGNLNWTLDDSGLLKIFGSGTMREMDSNNAWRAHYSEIKRIILYSGLTNVSNNAFKNCSNLVSVSIPVSVTSIGNAAFDCCSSLSDIYYDGSHAMWEAVTAGSSNEPLSIANIHFMGEVYTVTYNANGGNGTPASQTKIHERALALTSTKLTRASSSVGSYTVALNANGGSVSPSSITAERTKSYTFKNWNTMADGSGTSYEPGASYTTDADMTLYAQWNSSTTTASVTLPTPTRTDYIFKGWATSSTATSGTTGSYVPTGDVTLYAVWQNSVLDSGTWGDLNWTLDINGLLTFSGNGEMNDYNYNSLSVWHTYRDKIQKVVIEPGVTSIGKHAFYWHPVLTSISIPDTVTSIGIGAFDNCSNLTNISIPGNVTNIGVSAFKDCSNLTTISIPDGVTSIGNNTFLRCFKLKNVSIPDSVTSIGTYAFNACHRLTSISIPDSVTSIGDGAFQDSGITDVYYAGTQQQWSSISIGSNNSNLSKANIHYMSAIYTVTYNANSGSDAPASQTKTKGTVLTLSSAKPTRTGSSAVSCTVTLDANGGSVSPSSLTAARTTIYTFKNWNTKADGSGTSYNPGASYIADANMTLYAQWYTNSSTASINLPTPTREGYTFKGWASSRTATSGTTGIYFPVQNETLHAIWQPDTIFILPSELTGIEEEAFAGGAFSNVHVPEQVTTIGTRAFADCPNLRNIDIPESTISIASTAFANVSNLTIHGIDGSYAESYAAKHGFDFIPDYS